MFINFFFGVTLSLFYQSQTAIIHPSYRAPTKHTIELSIRLLVAGGWDGGGFINDRAYSICVWKKDGRLLWGHKK